MNLYSNIKKKLNESEDYEANRNDIIKQAAEYIFNDADGDWDSELIDYERFTDYYMDLNKRDFNKAIKLVQEALGNFAEHHYFDRDYNNISKNGALLELNDNHTMWELNNPTLDNDDSAWQLWDTIVTDKIDEFKDSTGEELYGCGRSGRHICVEPTFENCLNFNKLQEFQENLEDAAVEEFNNYRAEEFNESRKEIHEAEEEIDQHLLALVTKKKDLLTDDTIDDDTAYDLMERIDNELINSYSIEEIEKAEKLVGLDESEEKVVTNLDTNNMVEELRKHFKNVTNKDYIKKSLKMHLEKGFITKEEYDKLKTEYNLDESENTLFCIQDTSHPDFANKGYQTTQFDDLITFTSKDDAQKYINYLNTLDKDEYKIVDATTFNKDKMVVFNTFDEYKKSLKESTKNFVPSKMEEYKKSYKDKFNKKIRKAEWVGCIGNDSCGEDYVKINGKTYTFDIATGKLKESETEDYWDATELERKGFCALLKFNHPEKHMNPSMRYIITNDNNEVYRFAMQGSTEQIKDTGAKIEFRKYLNSNGLTESESLKESQTQEIEEIIADIRKEVPKIDEYLDAYYKKINAEEPKPKAFIKNKEMTINPDWEDWYRNTSNILYNEAAWDKFVAWVKKNYNVDINLNEAEGPYNQAFKVGSKLDLLLSELNTALLDGLKAIGYDEEFKKDYTSIEAKENENNIEIYFIAELDYEEGENIVYYHLDDVLEKYDKDAYFEASTSGRWIAVINKNMLNEAEGYIKPEEFDSMNDEDLDEYLKFLQSEWTYHTKKRQAEIGNEIDLIEKILTDRGFYIDTSNPDYNSLYFDMDGNQIDKNGNQIPENEPEITDRPKEGFVVFQTTKKEDDPQELEDMVFTSKEEAKEALEEWKNSYTDEEKEQFNPSGIIYKYKGKTPREINASKAQIAQELR